MQACWRQECRPVSTFSFQTNGLNQWAHYLVDKVFQAYKTIQQWFFDFCLEIDLTPEKKKKKQFNIVAKRQPLE